MDQAAPTTTSSNLETQTLHKLSFQFTGNGQEYFRIWIVNIMLSILTLGIYSAWAKVRNKQYFYGNTLLKDSAFEYTADPKQILKGRLVAVLAFFIFQLSGQFNPAIGSILTLVFLLIMPWILVKSLAFNARYSQYRGVPFQFTQNIKGAYWLFLGLPILIIIAIGLLIWLTIAISEGAQHFVLALIPVLFIFILLFLIMPFMTYKLKRYVVSHHRYGTSQFQYTLNSSKPYMLVYFIVFCTSILVLLLFSIAIGFSFESLNNINELDIPSWLGAIIPLAGFVFYMGVYAYISANTYNLTYRYTQLEQHKFRANMQFGSLLWLYVSNTLTIIFTLGLFIPWAKVRSARYRAAHTYMITEGSLDEFIAAKEKDLGSIGEELGEVFDLDVGI